MHETMILYTRTLGMNVWIYLAIGLLRFIYAMRDTTYQCIENARLDYYTQTDCAYNFRLEGALGGNLLIICLHSLLRN